MFQTIIVILVGMLGGVAVGIQSPIAGSMSQRVGGAASSLIVHVSGAIISGALLWARRGEEIENWGSLPWYMFASGIFGVILYMTLSYTLPRIGATTAIVLIIIGQLSIGMVIDQFGMFGVTPRAVDLGRLLAMVFLIAGGYLMIR